MAMTVSDQKTPKISSLKKRADFLLMNKEAQKWVSQGLVIQARPNGTDDMRIGFTVTKKVSKSAVTRNRIKRRLRAAAREVLPAIAKPGCDYVFIGRRETQMRDYTQLCKDVRWCLGKMGFVKDKSKQKISAHKTGIIN